MNQPSKMSITTRAVRIIAGLLFTSAAYILFLNPHGISVGGMTGLCVLINRYLNIPNTVALAVLNLFLFIYGWRVKGNAFTLRSVGAMLALGLLLDLPYPEITPLFGSILSMMIGSCLSGVGYGLIVSAETSTGGADQLGIIVTTKHPHLSVGFVMNVFDAFVVTVDSLLTGHWLFSAAASLTLRIVLQTGKGSPNGLLLLCFISDWRFILHLSLFHSLTIDPTVAKKNVSACFRRLIFLFS